MSIPIFCYVGVLKRKKEGKKLKKGKKNQKERKKFKKKKEKLERKKDRKKESVVLYKKAFFLVADP